VIGKKLLEQAQRTVVKLTSPLSLAERFLLVFEER
jgi:hypothetical protein